VNGIKRYIQRQDAVRLRSGVVNMAVKLSRSGGAGIGVADMAVSRSGGAVIVVSYSWVAHSGMYNEREDAVRPRNGVADMVLSY
jgi:hypothetical protein